MFTGIIRGTFKVTETQKNGSILTYTVALPEALTADLQIGASVAIDGVCQTVVKLGPAGVTFDAIEETLKLTTLDSLAPGSMVNVERSFRVGEEIGGHEVSGHVIGTGRLHAIHEQDGAYDLQIAVPTAWIKYIMPKGFIAVDGASLTVGKVEAKLGESEEGAFFLHLIPETLRLTTLGNKRVGDRVNIELETRTCAIVDTVERVLRERGLGG